MGVGQKNAGYLPSMKRRWANSWKPGMEHWLGQHRIMDSRSYSPMERPRSSAVQPDFHPIGFCLFVKIRKADCGWARAAPAWRCSGKAACKPFRRPTPGRDERFCRSLLIIKVHCGSGRKARAHIVFKTEVGRTIQ